MNRYGSRSIEVRATLHPDLVLIFNEAIMYLDISLYEGIRSDETQLKYFIDGKSKLDPRIASKRKYAKHLKQSDGYSHAVDCAPYPIDFSSKAKKRERFYFMAGIIKAISSRLYKEGKTTHVIRWGGDWDMDDDFNDQSFDDLPHFELRSR